MLVNNENYEIKNQELSQEDRWVLELAEDDAATNVHYFTSHDDIPLPVGSSVIHGCLKINQVKSQKLNFRDNNSTIGSISVKLIDLNNQVTNLFHSLLLTHVALFNKRVRLFHGYKDLGWSDYVPRVTQYINRSVTNNGVEYDISCADPQDAMNKTILQALETRLSSDLAIGDTQVSVYVTEGWQLIQRDADHRDAPNANVTYLEIADNKRKEWCKVTAVNTSSFTVVRGVLGTEEQDWVLPQNANEEKGPKVRELMFIEMDRAKASWAFLTGEDLDNPGIQLFPEHWHCGVPASTLVRQEFLDLKGNWEPYYRVGMKKTNGKKWIEDACLFPMMHYLRVNGLGVMNLKRVFGVRDTASSVAILDENNIAKLSPLKIDDSKIVNHITLNWSYDHLAEKPHYRRETTFKVGDDQTAGSSVHLYGERRETKSLPLINGMRSTSSTLLNMINAYTDRYAHSMAMTTAELSPQMNNLEVGDVVQVKYNSVYDFTVGTTIDRAMQITQIKVSGNGKVQVSLEGTTQQPDVLTDGNLRVMNDSYYESEGTPLPNVVSGTLNTPTTLNGGTDITAPANIYYHLGDLTIDTNKLKINGNIQLRVRGVLTLLGQDGIDCSEGGRITDGGYLGNTTGGNGSRIRPVEQSPGEYWWRHRINQGTTWHGQHDAAPTLDVINPDGLSLEGLPLDLRGTGGAYGAGTFVTNIEGQLPEFENLQGASAVAGGSGLLIVSRGFIRSGAGSVKLDGAPANSKPSMVSQITGETVYAGGSARGAPGCLIYLFDGVAEIPQLAGYVSAVGDDEDLKGQAVRIQAIPQPREVVDDEPVDDSNNGTAVFTQATAPTNGQCLKRYGRNLLPGDQWFDDSDPQLLQLRTYDGANWPSGPRRLPWEDVDGTPKDKLLNSAFDKGPRFWSANYVGEEVADIQLGPNVESIIDGVSGGRVLRLTGNTNVYSSVAIPVENLNDAYRMVFRVRQQTDPTVGGSLVYAGVATLDKNFNNLTGGAGTHRYFCASAQTITTVDGWKIYSGYIKGVGDNSNNFRAGTAYVRPMFIVNYSGGNGVCDVDLISFERIQNPTDIRTGAGWNTLPEDGATLGADWTTTLYSRPSDNVLLNSYQTWAEVSGSGRPADNATVGARWGVDLLERPGNLATLIGSEGILNSGLTLNTDGTLYDSEEGVNRGVVTIGGLGYSGDLDADRALPALSQQANVNLVDPSFWHSKSYWDDGILSTDGSASNSSAVLLSDLGLSPGDTVTATMYVTVINDPSPDLIVRSVNNADTTLSQDVETITVAGQWMTVTHTIHSSATKLLVRTNIDSSNFYGEKVSVVRGLYPLQPVRDYGTRLIDPDDSTAIDWSDSHINGRPTSVFEFDYTGALNANHIDNTSQLTDGAQLGLTSVWSGVTERPSDDELLNYKLENGVLKIPRPVGAAAESGNGTNGAIKISLPVLWTNTMMRFVVDVYEYATDRSFSVEVGGYNYAQGNTWYNTFATITGRSAAQNTVRFGHDGTKACIWIGETSKSWSYPKVSVRDFQAGHSGASVSNWLNGWGVSFETAFDTIQRTHNRTMGSANWSDTVDDDGYRPEDGSTLGAPLGTPVGNRTADQISATVIGSGELASNTSIDQGDGFLRSATRGLATGFARNGDSVSFPQAWDQIPTVRFAAGGLTQATSLTGNQFQNISATSVSTSGFTVSAKVQELAGSTTLHTDTGSTTAGTLDYEMHKSQSAQAYDDQYTFQYDVTVNNHYDNESGNYFSGSVKIGFYTNDGGGWVKRAEVTHNGSNSTSSTTYSNNTKTISVDGLTNHGGREFAIHIESSGLAGGSIGFDNVKYTTATAPAETSATPSGAPDIQYFVLGGE